VELKVEELLLPMAVDQIQVPLAWRLSPYALFAGRHGGGSKGLGLAFLAQRPEERSCSPAVIGGSIRPTPDSLDEGHPLPAASLLRLGVPLQRWSKWCHPRRRCCSRSEIRRNPRGGCVEDLIAFWFSRRVLLAKLQGSVVILFLSGSLLVICAPTVLMAAFSGASAPITVQKKILSLAHLHIWTT
jgi:hypothetical protein